MGTRDPSCQCDAVWPLWTVWRRLTPSRGPATPRVHTPAAAAGSRTHSHTHAHSCVTRDGSECQRGVVRTGDCRSARSRKAGLTPAATWTRLRETSQSQKDRRCVSLREGLRRGRCTEAERTVGRPLFSQHPALLVNGHLHLTPFTRAERRRSWVHQPVPRSPVTGSCSFMLRFHPKK